jgi:2-amino-4-hydroxy-6-hydroxymethyldihydropteridine diphosphokinase
MSQVFVGLGSNLGERLSYLRLGLSSIAKLERTSVVNCSSVYETQPVGVKEQPQFLNMVVELDSKLVPLDIFHNMKDIENKIGRVHNERWGPREIDLDLLYYDREIFNDGKLCIPHPQIVNRRFVLVPLKEIAPEFLDPVQKVSIGELLRRCPDVSDVFKYERSTYTGETVIK